MNQSIKVYYATNRESIYGDFPDSGNGFYRDSPHNLRFGGAGVTSYSNDDYVVESVHVAKDPVMEETATSQDALGEVVVNARETFEKLRIVSFIGYARGANV